MFKKFLSDLRNSCQKRNIPIISTATQDFISKILSDQKPKFCVEIGGAVGYSGIFMANTIEAWGGEIVSFELSYPNYKEGLSNILESGVDNLISYNFNFIKVNLEKFLNQKADFVFIDAMKNKYLEFVCEILPFLSDKYTIILDDVIKYQTKMTSLYEFLEQNQINYEILQLDEDDGVMIIRKQ